MYFVVVACEVVISILCKGLRLILKSEIFNIRSPFIWFWELICCLQLYEYLLGVSILLFVICTHCVVSLLHEGRTGGGQCDQDTKTTSIVGKNKEII